MTKAAGAYAKVQHLYACFWRTATRHPRKLIVVAAATALVAVLANAQNNTDVAGFRCSGLSSAETASCASLVNKLGQFDRLLIGFDTLVDQMLETQSEISRDGFLQIMLARDDARLTQMAQETQLQLHEAQDGEVRVAELILQYRCLVAEVDGKRRCPCLDELDNDNDGKIDRADPECYDNTGAYDPFRIEAPS